MEPFKRLFEGRKENESQRGRMSSDDGNDRPPPSKPSGGFSILRGLSTSRPKSQNPTNQSDGSPEQSSPGRLARTLSRGPGAHVNTASRTSPAMSMSSQTGQPSGEKILQDVKPQNSESVRHTAIQSASGVSHNMDHDDVLEILGNTKDLLGPDAKPEIRLAIYSILEDFLKRNDVSLSQDKHKALFTMLSTPSAADDLNLRLECLTALLTIEKQSGFEPLRLLPLISRWIDQWYVDASARRQEQKDRGANTDGGLGRGNSVSRPQPSSSKAYDEKAFFSRISQFACYIIRDETRSCSENDIKQLLEQLLKICKKTTVMGDIENAIMIFDALLQRSLIPDASLGNCIDVLCGTFWTVKPLRVMSYDSICNLLKSEKHEATLNMMFKLLEAANGPDNLNLNSVRGIIGVLGKVVLAPPEDNLPKLDFTSMIRSLICALERDSPKMEGDILILCQSYLEDSTLTWTLEQDLADYFHLIGRCSKRIYSSPKKDDEDKKKTTSSKTNHQSDALELIATWSLNISRSLGSAWERLSNTQKFLAAAYMTKVFRILDHPEVQILTHYYYHEGLDAQHERCLENANYLVYGVYLNNHYPTDTRLFALYALHNAYRGKRSSKVLDATVGVFGILLKSLETESDWYAFSATVDFLVDLVDINDIHEEEKVLKGLLSFTTSSSQERKLSFASSPLEDSTGSIEPISSSSNAEHQHSSGPTKVPPSFPNTASKGLVKIALRSLKTSAGKASLAFDTLLDLVRSKETSTDARITSLKFLFRVRSDTNGAIYVISESESEHVAVALCRTVETENLSTRRDDKAADRNLHADDGTSSQGTRSSGLSRSGTRGASWARPLKPTPPLWMYPGPKGLPEDPPSEPSEVVFSSFAFTEAAPEDGANTGRMTLKINQWLELVIALLQRKDEDWEVYSYVVVHLGPQLMNTCLFQNCVPQLKLLRSVLCDQVFNSSFFEPSPFSGLRKSDVALCIFHSITVLVTYHAHFSRGEEDDLVRSLTQGIGLGDGTSRPCIHALSICCHEIPLSVTRVLSLILEKMSTIITQSHLAVHILEFLAELARLPEVYINLRDELRVVFGVCARYLQTAREHRRGVPGSSMRTSYASRHSGGAREFATIPESAGPSASNDLPQYVYALTYHVMIFWFLSLKLHDRANHVKWITRNLVFKDENNNDALEEQSEVFIDMMMRTTYSDLGDTVYKPDFAKPSDGPVQKRSWLVGMCLLTVETAGTTGLTQITKRQASGTTHAIYQQFNSEPLPHHIPLSSNIRAGNEEPVSMLPSHVLLQLTSSPFPIYVEMQPLQLPDDESTNRAIRNFDRNDIVDGHKVGVVYVGPGQAKETDILANCAGSLDYDDFLEGLGTKVPLDGAKFNTQGLDKSTDGTHTYAWRDRVTEIIYHVTTLMPTNLEIDPICAQKKRHIGNDFVTIVFNESTLPFEFDTIPSQFNYVNIVITPANRLSKPLGDLSSTNSEGKVQEGPQPKSRPSFFKVQVVSKPGFPSISPASDIKLLSKESLPAFVRLISLNASVFSLVWSKRKEKDDHISSWSNRLRAIKELRRRTLEKMVKGSETTTKTDSSLLRRTSNYPEGENTRLKSLAVTGGNPQVDNLVDVMAFSGWTELEK
jgi:hypothetical protein